MLLVEAIEAYLTHVAQVRRLAPATVRAYRADLDSDEDPQTMERLRVQTWPAAAAPMTVAKRWRPPT